MNKVVKPAHAKRSLAPTQVIIKDVGESIWSAAIFPETVNKFFLIDRRQKKSKNLIKQRGDLL